MNKRMRDILALIEEKKIKAQELLVAKDIDGAAKIRDEIKNLRSEYDIEKDLFEENPQASANAIELGTKELNNLQLIVFAKVLAGKRISEEKEIKALSSLTGEDGKLIIPQDLRTRINEYMRDYPDFAIYCSREDVNTLSGSRIYERNADAVPLDGVAEMVAIPTLASPKFDEIKYAVNYFKGKIKIPNELIKNETGGLMAYLARWFAKKIVATHNTLLFYANGVKAEGILGVTYVPKAGETPQIGIATESLAAVVTVKKIKEVLNKKLPTSISNSPRCIIVTNQSGLQVVDELEDGVNRPLLQPDVTQPTIMKIKGKTLVVFPDNVLQNKDFAGTMKAPMIFGNPVEAITLFERQATQIDSSFEAGFDDDTTVMRIITGMDTKFFDKEALYVLYTPLA